MFYDTQYKYTHAFIISSEYIDFMYVTSFQFTVYKNNTFVTGTLLIIRF